MLKIALIGSGYWGKHHLRVLSRLPCKLIALVDLDVSKKILADSYDIDFLTDYRLLVGRVDSVVIVTPPSTHYKIAKFFLENRIHVFLEKPFTMKLSEAKYLEFIAKNNKLILASGHIYLYNWAIRKIKQLIVTKKLGDLYYIYVNWLNLGIIRHDVDALWNFAPHPFSILNYLFDCLPQKLLAVGGSFINQGINDLVMINLKYPENTIVQINLSWIHPQKTRNIVIVGSKKMVIFSDIIDQEKLKVFDKSITAKEYKQSLEFADFTEFLNKTKFFKFKVFKKIQKEPLQLELIDFLKAIKYKIQPVSDITSAKSVLSMLEACDKSIKKGNIWVKIN
jgi:predicted dehydrogenase